MGALKKEEELVAEQQLVVFALGKEEFGIDISKVREIVRIQNITTIPQSMDFVEGIVNLRGQIVPIVDLCKRFLVVERDAGKDVDRRIIVVNMAEQNIGILVDGVSEILRVPDESIEPTPPMVTSGMSSEFIRGVAKVKERLIIVLDLDRIFSSEEREMLSQPAV
jgi:purine-binding chemotaxis protein CheW